MPRQPLELPLAVARSFVRDMRAFFATSSIIKQDEIAARQLHVLNAFRGLRDNARLRLVEMGLS